MPTAGNNGSTGVFGPAFSRRRPDVLRSGYLDTFGVTVAVLDAVPVVGGPLRPLPLKAPVGVAAKGAPRSEVVAAPARSAGAGWGTPTPDTGAGVQTFPSWAKAGMASRLVAMMRARMSVDSRLTSNAADCRRVADCLRSALGHGAGTAG